MMINKYNDNELLYLMSENDESAFEILCEKYRPLIVNRLRRFKINEKNYDDFYQECLMVLHYCAENYREDKSYTFNIYLDVSIQNKIRNLLRKDKGYYYGVSLFDFDKIDMITLRKSQAKYHEEETIDEIFNRENIKKINNKFEKEVMQYYFDGKNVKWIASNLKVALHRIYYVLSKYKVKRKVTINLWDGIFSDLEKQVYQFYSRNFRPSEIAHRLDCNVSIVYNAIKRIKLKSK